MNLGDLSENFGVSEFYKAKLARSTETIKSKPQNQDRKKPLFLINIPFFVKDTLGYYKSEGRYPEDLYLESIKEWMVRNKKPIEIFGYENKNLSYREEKDTLAILNIVPFPTINMIEDKDGNLMYLEESYPRIQTIIKIYLYILKKIVTK